MIQFPKTEVLNWHHLPENKFPDASYVYIGRKDSRVSMDVPGGSGTFGNPFSSGTREENIERFEEYFLYQMGIDSQFKFMVSWVQGKKLVCWCSPLACHGDVIARYVDKS